jgi:hypothetical protein
MNTVKQYANISSKTSSGCYKNYYSLQDGQQYLIK